MEHRDDVRFGEGMMRTGLMVEHVGVVAEMTTDAFRRLMRAMFGPVPIPPLTVEQMQWEDDGGPPFVAYYEHTIGAS